MFSVTGVAHLLAVSGFHVAVVGGFLSFLFLSLEHRRVGRGVRYYLLIVLTWGFTLISGAAIPALRAAFMMTLYILGKLISRKSDIYNTLAASAFCLLWYNPHYLFDIGFQLSYTAVLSIHFFMPRLKNKIYVRNPWLLTPWQWLMLSLSAQIGVTFLCLYHFGFVSTVSLLVNLPLTGIATLLIPLTWVWLLLPAFIPGVNYLPPVIEYLTHQMMQIVETFSRMPGNTISIPFNTAALVISYALLIGLCIYLRPRWKPWKRYNAII
jgi:competence protein ComEC